ncbi:MAG: autotransporter-associated beta strand repeat-containing protein, partial [Akkermansiaceae bacterium]
ALASNNTGGLTKTGNGTLILSGSNAYTGGTILGQGTLRLDHVHAAGSGTITQSNASSTLQINTTGSVTNAMSIFNVSFTESATLTGAKTLNNATIDVATGETVTEQGVLSGDGGLIKEGGGTYILNGSADNTYTGATVINEGSLVLSNSSGNAINNSASITVNSGGTLVLGASNQIGDGIGLVLNGGTFLVGASTLSESLGTLTLSASSTIDFGAYGETGFRQLTFADSSAIEWTGTLTITNWQGVAQTSSEFTQLVFGTGGLSSTQLSQVVWANQDINGGELLDGSGELVPIPEAPVVWGAAAVALFIAWRERRRLRFVFGAIRSKLG